MNQVIVNISSALAIVQTSDKCYTDSYENYLSDGGEALPSNVTSIDCNLTTKSCFINGNLQDNYENEYAKRVLTLIDQLTVALESRTRAIVKEQSKATFERYDKEAQEREEQRLAAMTLEEFKAENSNQVSGTITQLYSSGVESSLGFKVGFSDADLKLYAARIATMDDDSTAELTDYDGIKRYNITKSNFITLQREAYAEYLRLLSAQDDYVSRINAATDKESVLAVISEIKSLVEN